MAIQGYDLYDDEVMGSAPAPTGYDELDIMGPSQFSAPIDPSAASDPRNLIVQGGPTVPEGMISVNGQLERSQAAPQPLPWWIRAYDEYKAQRQAEDDAYRMLQRIQSDMPAGAGANSGQKAMQLQAKLMYDADLRRGVPPHEALAKHGVGLFGQTAPRAAVSAVRAGVPRTITPYEQERLALSKQQLDESKKRHKDTMDLARGKQTDSVGIAEKKSRQQAMIKLGDFSQKWLEANPFAGRPNSTRYDPKGFKEHTDNVSAAAGVLRQLAGLGAETPGATPAAPSAKQVTRVKNKKTGKTQIYEGNPSDIPKDRFDILK